MNPIVVTTEDNDEPTKPVNDCPALLKCRRIARLAYERLTVNPDEGAIDLARNELCAIEAICNEALR
jgi:hypothetical protein